MTHHPTPNLQIRTAKPTDDAMIARHLWQLAQDVGTPEAAIKPNWLEVTQAFIQQVRQVEAYQGFIAEVDGIVVGSSGCQLHARPYPQIWTEDYWKLGYIWGIYVEPDYRQRGIGRELTQVAIAYLKSLRCTRILLHASPFGQPVYAKLGFVDSNEMVLDPNHAD